MSRCAQVKQFEVSISLPGLCLSISILPRHTSHLHPPAAHPPHRGIVRHDAAVRKLPSLDVMRMLWRRAGVVALGMRRRGAAADEDKAAREAKREKKKREDVKFNEVDV